MLDSLDLFEELSHNAFLENTEFILFLNKQDLFVEKLKTSNLSACFPDYDGKQFVLVVGTWACGCHLLCECARACVRAEVVGYFLKMSNCKSRVITSETRQT